LSRPQDGTPLGGGPRHADLARADAHRATLHAEARRHGAAMLRKFGGLYHALGLGRLLGRLRFEDHSAERVRAAAARGPITYVMLGSSTLDYLALNTVLNRRRLPLAAWANGLSTTAWRPLREAYTLLVEGIRERLREGPRPDPVRSGWVADALSSGSPIALFVEGRRTWRQVLTRQPPEDPLESLLHAQHRCAQPIQLLPVVVVWDRAPDVGGSAVSQWLLGGREAPGLLARLRHLFARRQAAFIQVGDPLDLGMFMYRVPSPRQPRALRTLLRRYLRQESTVVRGPRLLPRSTMRRIVLDNPPMRMLAAREADATGHSVERIRGEQQRAFDTIAAGFRWWVIQLLHLVLRPLWTRVYSGVDVREEDLEAIRTAMRSGTAVLVPSHKSHLDYVLLSWLMYENDLIVPHVVAGVNLAIWPISFFLRGAGAFFVLRSFGEDRTFPAVFGRYLRELVRQGYPIEFFIEGGRTRTGKLLSPKLGVLGMVLEAAEHRRTGQKVTLLPISLAYEKVAEEASYARELRGERKEAESLGQLVRARSVLRQRFGRVYLRVGQPLSAAEIVDPSPRFSGLDPLDRQERLHHVGEQIVYRIGRSTVVLPTSLVALALLCHHRLGIRHSELLARIERLRAFLAAEGATEASSLRAPAHAIARALDRFRTNRVAGRARPLVDHFDDDDPVWAPVVDQRVSLDFYKNQLLHWFAPAAMAAAAIRALPVDAPFTVDQVRPRFIALVWLLRREVLLDPERSATVTLRGALDALVRHGGLIAHEDGTWSLADVERMGELYGLLRADLEAYALVLDAAPKLLVGRAPDPRALSRILHSEGELRLANGRITRAEALSHSLLQNAVSAALKEGVLETDTHGHVVVHAQRHAKAVAQLEGMVEA
jgi:glycerol-3-phosphate O-acyltransferase